MGLVAMIARSSAVAEHNTYYDGRALGSTLESWMQDGNVRKLPDTQHDPNAKTSTPLEDATNEPSRFV